MLRHALVVGVLWVGACGGPTVPDGRPTIDGEIVSWASIPVPAGGGERTVTVRVAEGECSELEAVVPVDGESFVVREANGSVVAALEEDLEFGLRIRVWTVEPVDSCPWSGHATVAELVR